MLLRRDRAFIAITVMLDVAFHASRTRAASAADIAQRLGLARRGMEPLLQILSRRGLLESVRGPRGGYRLGRVPRSLRLDEIVAAVVNDGEEPSVDHPTGPMLSEVVMPLWAEIERAATAELAAITLGDLVKRAVAAGITRPEEEPVDFVI